MLDDEGEVSEDETPKENQHLWDQLGGAVPNGLRTEDQPFDWDAYHKGKKNK